MLLIAGVAGVAGAQTAGDQGTGGNHTANSSTTSRSTKGKKGKQAHINERVIYRSPKTGQAATYTGQQATSVNGTNSSNPKIATRKQ